MLSYFLIISIVMFFLIRSQRISYYSEIKDPDLRERVQSQDEFLNTPLLLFLYFPSLLFVILFDITYKFGITGFFIGLFLIIITIMLIFFFNKRFS